MSVGKMGLPKFLQYSNTSNSHLAVDKESSLVRA